MSEEQKSLVAANAALSNEKLQEYLKIAGVAQNLKAEERAQFIEIAQAYGLNPFKREIYCTTYGEGQYRKTSIITGYEVYIKRAERTGQLDGWETEISGSGKDMKAVITIYRKDRKHPFKHEVYYDECVQTKKDGTPNAIWGKQPRFMLKKVAIAQGFRLCFSDELGGMPYTSDEMPANEAAPAKPAEVVEAEIVPPALTEVEKAEISACENSADLSKKCKALLNKRPELKKEIVAAFNARLAEINSLGEAAND